MNKENIDEYNNCLRSLQQLFTNSVDSYLLLDTSNMSMSDTSIEVASRILPVMKKRYIKAFQQKYNLK